ncbi:MAG TPA: hypothetical protein VKR22_11000, partial [Acidimicrobiales bacterium]|nr:hypothetical protein [Acidimicrobiales bacterium]
AAWPGVARAALAPTALAATALVALVSVPAPVAQAAAGPGSATGSDVPVAGSGGLGRQVPITLLGGRVPSARSPLRVLLVGDSVMQTESPAIRAALEATGAAVVDTAAFPGWGLSSDPTWPTTFPPWLARFHPDLVVGMWSWDDNLALDNPTGYRAELSRFVRLLLHPGHGIPGVSGVLFQQFPPLIAVPGTATAVVSENRRRDGALAWSRVTSTLPPLFPGRVQYLPLAPSVELDGRFAMWLPPLTAPHAPPAQWIRVRMIDATHFCPAGAARYADALLTDLQSELHLPAAARSWWSGSWTKNAYYRAAEGDCPADHPPA